MCIVHQVTKVCTLVEHENLFITIDHFPFILMPL
jgi:hypothetical protein